MENDNNLPTHSFVAGRLQLLDPPSHWDPDPRLALAKHRRRLSEIPAAPSRTWWRWAVPAMCAGFVAVLLALPAGRSLAQNLWTLIHVRSMGVIQANFDALPDSLQAKMVGEPPSVKPAPDVDAAAALAGFVPHLPQPIVLTGTPKLSVTSAMHFALTVRRADLNEALRRAGIHDRTVPPEWDGAEIGLHTLPLLNADYGSVGLMQTPPPVITTPPALPFDGFVNTVLRIAGLSDSDARRMAASMAAAPSFLFPIDREDAVLMREVKLVSGNGTLVHDLDNNDGSLQQSTLLWSTPDRLYVLIGKLADDQLIAIANSIR